MEENTTQPTAADVRKVWTIAEPAITKKQRKRAEDLGLKKRLWDRSMITGPDMSTIDAQGNAVPTVFETYDRSRYLVHKSGAFFNLTRNRLSPKLRKAARRAERAGGAS